MEQENYSSIFLAALLEGLGNAVSMTWAWSLENPWIFVVVGAAFLLRWLEAKQGRRGRRR